MLRVAKILTICLLLFAIPVKGAFAVAIVLWGSAHETSSAAMVLASVAPNVGDAAHAHHDHPSHLKPSASGEETGHVAGSHDHESWDKHGTVKCTICADCCVGGAFLAFTDVLVPASVGTDAHFPALDVQFPWTVIAGLERPPRTLVV
ncbi:MAG: hypothetical protein ABIP49_00990 [Lysobacterales bacterium]